jgi:hypothetical protein
LSSDFIVLLQESERDSPKKWSPLVEMQYRGGIYRGRCQGGLPEGKVLFHKILTKINFWFGLFETVRELILYE